MSKYCPRSHNWANKKKSAGPIAALSSLLTVNKFWERRQNWHNNKKQQNTIDHHRRYQKALNKLHSTRWCIQPDPIQVNTVKSQSGTINILNENTFVPTKLQFIKNKNKIRLPPFIPVTLNQLLTIPSNYSSISNISVR